MRAYWKPVYKHLRMKWNRGPDVAGDLTQGFFARAFEKRYFTSYEPGKALFRTYLKACLDRFVMETARDESRQKRGGGTVRVSLDFELAEEELARTGTSAGGDVDALFDTEWTRNLLATAVGALETACKETGKETYFAVFRRYVLDGDATRPSYAAVADELGIKATDVTNYLAWTRREVRRLTLDALRELTATDEEWRSEARAVLGVDP